MSEQLLQFMTAKVSQHFPEKNEFILKWKITFLWMWFWIAKIAYVWFQRTMKTFPYLPFLGNHICSFEITGMDFGLTWWKTLFTNMMAKCNSLPKNKNLLKIYSPLGHPRCRWVCFFIEKNLEKLKCLHHLLSSGSSLVNGCRLLCNVEFDPQT